MDYNSEKKLPPIGMRIIKSFLGVGLCFLIYILRGYHGTPFYSALAVLWCIQSHTKDTKMHATQRVVGTAVGAVYGMIFILCKMYIYDFGYGLIHYIILSAFIIPVIYTTVLMNKGNASYFACVVYLSIVVNHLIDENPFVFVINRSLDTLIGIMLGLFVNSIHFHGKGNKNILFVVDLDNSLNETYDNLTPYSRVTMQNLIGDGILLTIMTMKTPAAYLEALSDIRPLIPIIAMDGAILYDITENSYPYVYIISAVHAKKLEKRIRADNFQLFTTVIIDDVLIIYYDEPHNNAAKDIYNKLHRSPYRNYLKKERPEIHPVVYFMLIDETKKIDGLYDSLLHEGLVDELKIIKYESEDYLGYSYMKIYNKNASVENMIDYLKEKLHKDNIITFGDYDSRYDTDYKGYDCNEIVNVLQKKYYSNKLYL